MNTFKTYGTIICVHLLRKFFIFDIPGVSGDGSDWALAPSLPPVSLSQAPRKPAERQGEA